MVDSAYSTWWHKDQGVQLSIAWTYSLLRCPLIGFDFQLQLVHQVLETSNVLTILLSL